MNHAFIAALLARLVALEAEVEELRIIVALAAHQ